jgi:DNA repair protein RadC
MAVCRFDYNYEPLDAAPARLRDILTPPPPDADQCRSVLADLIKPFAGGNIEPIVQRLYREFGSVNAVVAARTGRLRSILPDHPEVVQQLRRVSAAMTHCARSKLRLPAEIMQGRTLIDFLRHRIGFEPVEVTYALYFSVAGNLLTDGIVARGTFDRCPVEPKELVRAALDVGAASIIIAHNHPSGDPKPSHADIQITRDIDNACRAVNARVCDHIIMGNPDFSSFRELGLL